MIILEIALAVLFFAEAGLLISDFGFYNEVKVDDISEKVKKKILRSTRCRQVFAVLLMIGTGLFFVEVIK